MSLDWPVILRALQSILGLWGLVYIVTALQFPAWFVKYMSFERWGKNLDVLLVLAGIIFMLPVGTLVYSALYAPLAVIPFDWGWHDEEGEWSTFRDAARNIMTVIGTIWLTVRLDQVATEAASFGKRT